MKLQDFSRAGNDGRPADDLDARRKCGTALPKKIADQGRSFFDETARFTRLQGHVLQFVLS